MKKCISWLLALILICAPLSAAADDNANIGYIPKSSLGFAEPIHPVQLAAVGADVWENVKGVILNGLKNHEAEIQIPTAEGYDISAATKDEMEKYASALYFEVLDENPDIFYAFTGVSFSFLLDSEEGPYHLSKMYPYYIDGAYELRDVFNLRIENILNQTIRGDMTDMQKAFALHDYLIANTTYGYRLARAEAFPEKYAGTPKANEPIAVCRLSEHMAEVISKNDLSDEEDALKNKMLSYHTAYGVVMDGVGVCQSYSLAYNILCRKAGIECINVYSNGIGHMWNMVKIGGEWYNVDVTYDDPIYENDNIAENDLVQSVFGGNHANLLISDETMRENHLDNNGQDGSDAYVYGKNPLPVCGSKTYESNQIFSNVKNPMHYYGGYYYYTKSYSDAGDQYFRISSAASAQPETIPKQQYTAFVNMAAAAPYAAAGGDTSVNMYVKEGAELTSVHIDNIDKIGFQLTSNDADKINIWIGYYNAAGVLVNCRMKEITPENGSADMELQKSDMPPSGAVQARIFIWDGQNNILRPLTEDFIKIA